MLKTLLRTILIVSFSFSVTACTHTIKDTIYVEASCPKIEVLNRVDDISITVDGNSTITPESISNLIRGSKQLRRSENYYIDQVTKYNLKFIDKID